jgi:hypothetical protein
VNPGRDFSPSPFGRWFVVSAPQQCRTAEPERKLRRGAPSSFFERHQFGARRWEAALFRRVDFGFSYAYRDPK